MTAPVLPLFLYPTGAAQHKTPTLGRTRQTGDRLPPPMLNVRVVVLGHAALFRCTVKIPPGAAGPTFAATTFLNA